LQKGLLDQSIDHRRDAQLALAAFRLRDHHFADRTGPVVPQAQEFFLAAETIAKPPPFRAGGLNQNEQSLFISLLDGLVGWLGSLDSRVCERRLRVTAFRDWELPAKSRGRWWNLAEGCGSKRQ
jgi:hypothetical protein